MYGMGQDPIGVDLTLQYREACPPPNRSSIERIFAAIDETTLADWLSLDTGTRQLSQAVLQGDAGRLVQMVADSRCDPPHPFVRRLYELLAVVEGTGQLPGQDSNLPPGTTYFPPGGPPGGDALNKMLPWLLGGLGAFFLLQGDRKRTRSRRR